MDFMLFDQIADELCSGIRENNEKIITTIKNQYRNLDEEFWEELWKNVIIYYDITKLGNYEGFPDSDYVDSEGNSLLHYAAESNFVQNVFFLLEKGCDKNSENKNGITPFCLACSINSRMEIIQALKTDNTPSEKINEVFVEAAAFNENPEVLSFLRIKGADLEFRNQEGYTALLKAARYQINPDVIKRLVDIGADIDAETPDGQKCIHLCTFNENPEIAFFFLKVFGLYDCDIHGNTPMDYAFSKDCRKEITEAFLNKQLEENIINACRNPDNRIIRLMVDRGLDVNFRFSDGLYLIHYAAMYAARPDRIYYLLSLGAIPDVEDSFGRNVLHYATYTGNKLVFEKLIGDPFFSRLSTRKDINGYSPVDIC